MSLGKKLFYHWNHRRCAQEHGFLIAARMEQAVCKNMPPLGICRELNFINCHKINRFADGHGFNSTDIISRVRR